MGGLGRLDVVGLLGCGRRLAGASSAQRKKKMIAARIAREAFHGRVLVDDEPLVPSPWAHGARGRRAARPALAALDGDVAARDREREALSR